MLTKAVETNERKPLKGNEKEKKKRKKKRKKCAVASKRGGYPTGFVPAPGRREDISVLLAASV